MLHQQREKGPGVMQIRAIFLSVVAMSVTGCATVEKDRVVSQGVVLPNSMCAKHGTAAMSNDAPGHRMVCEFEELVGTHLPKCICRDEQQIVADRAASQQAITDMEQHKCVSNGGGACN